MKTVLIVGGVIIAGILGIGWLSIYAITKASIAEADMEDYYVCPKYGSQNRDCYKCKNVAYNFDGDLDCNVSGKIRKANNGKRHKRSDYRCIV